MIADGETSYSSKVGCPNVDGGSRTEVLEMAIDPCLRSISPQRAELPEEPAISVEFARGSANTGSAFADIALSPLVGECTGQGRAVFW
jgi:hypothetical protein